MDIYSVWIIGRQLKAVYLAELFLWEIIAPQIFVILSS